MYGLFIWFHICFLLQCALSITTSPNEKKKIISSIGNFEQSGASRDVLTIELQREFFIYGLTNSISVTMDEFGKLFCASHLRTSVTTLDQYC